MICLTADVVEGDGLHIFGLTTLIVTEPEQVYPLF
jgi:hypothetical protein